MAYWWIILLFLVVIISALMLYIKFQFYPAETMKIPLQSDDIELMTIKEGNVNCFIVKNGLDVIMFDSGLGRNTMKEIQKLGVAPEEVSHVFLTHSDYDHVGGLKFFSQAQIYFGTHEEKMLTGEIKRFLGIVSNDPIQHEHKLINDNEIIEVGNLSIKAIHTPGHTFGHTCFVLNNKMVFTGDILRIRKGRIKSFLPFLNISNKQVRESLTKLVQELRSLPLEIMCTGHTGYSNRVQILLQSWL